MAKASLKVTGKDAFKRLEREHRDVMREAMISTAYWLKDECVRILVGEGYLVSGRLVNSIRVEELKTFVRLYSNDPAALAVEYGRRPGKFPPPNEIIKWVMAKHLSNGEDAQKIAYLVGRKIAREGTEPVRFMSRAIAAVDPIMQAKIQTRVNQWLATIKAQP